EAHAAPERPIEAGLQEPRGEASGEDEAARRQRLDRQLAGEVLVRLHRVLDDDPPRAVFQELANGQAAPPLAERDDDPIGQDPIDDGRELCERAPGELLERRLSKGGAVIDDADDAIAVMPPGLELLDEPPGDRTRSHDEYAFPERAALQDVVGDDPEGQDE